MKFAGEWKLAAEETPDDNTTVLVGFADGEVDLGYLDAGTWRAQHNDKFDPQPVLWAHTPEVPEVSS